MGNDVQSKYPPVEYQPWVYDLINKLSGFGKAIGDILVPNATANTQRQANDLNQQTQQLNPYQEGVKKALKSTGELHATEAIQQGVPPEHIIQQSGLSNEQKQNDDPLKTLATLLATHLSTQQNNNIQDIPQQTNVDTMQNTIPFPQPAKGFFSGASISPDGTMNQEGIGNKLLRSMLGVGGQSNVDALYNARQLQKLTGQEPLQKSEYQKADLEVSKAIKMAQQVPLTQEQQGILTAGSNSAKLQIFNDSSARLNAQIDTLNKQKEAELKTIPPGMALRASLSGKPISTPRIKQIDSQLFKLNNALGALNKQGAMLQLQNPAKGVPVHTDSQINTYNKARASGLSIEEAKKKAGL